MSGSQAVGFRRTSFLSILVCAVAITACGGGGGGNGTSTSGSNATSSPTSTGSVASSGTDAQTSSPTTSASSGGPTISGTPAASINVGATYKFVPTVADANGDPLTFSIQNMPTWATFDAGTGTLSGAPATGDVNTYANIVITVSDGKTSVALPAFSIAVTQMASGSVQLTWTPPTQNTDDTALANISGYRIYYGTDPNNLDQLIIVDKNTTAYLMQNLSPAQWYFAVSAITTDAYESDASNVVSKVIS
jgi:hypothetical protein